MISEPQKMIDEKDGYFTGRLYEFLEGEILEEMEYSSSQMTELGNQLGLFHKNACDLDIQRDSLDTAPYFNFKKYVPSDQTSILESFQTLMNEINAIERTPETWGLTHGDCHPGNVMARGNNLTLIDFNDSGFNYFLNDIAIVLYMTFPPEDVDEKEFMMTAFKDFMKGYRQHMNPSAEVLDKLPLFFKLRTLMFHTLEAWMFPFYSKEEQEEAKAGIEKRIKRVESDFESLKYMFEIPFSKL
jgi:Ser/Thr protein kinase RdoA (MazF antagonist)